ncbi:hypothetical protein L195_g045558, partial [Trifolium pratense]
RLTKEYAQVGQTVDFMQRAPKVLVFVRWVPPSI